MDWYYSQMRETHAVLAWCVVVLFAMRGLAFQLGASWSQDVRLGVLAFGAAVLLTITGLSLWALIHHSPLRDNWLAAKLLALAACLACAYWARSSSEFRALGYIGAVMLLAYVLGVSVTREPLLGL